MYVAAPLDFSLVPNTQTKNKYIWGLRNKEGFMSNVDSEGPDQTAHMRSLI